MADGLMDSQAMIAEIRDIMQKARNNVARQINNELLMTYWNIGRIIVEHEQNNSDRAAYGQETLRQLSRTLTKEFGKGFSVSNLQFMRRFYQTYQIQQTVSAKLTWSHYCELLIISDPDRRSFYEKECVRSGNAAATVQDFDEGIRKRFFCFQPSVYETVLSDVSDSTDSVC